jgi:hypothetical protein
VALSMLVWGILDGLLSYTHDLVITIFYPYCQLVGSVLHGSEREGRQQQLGYSVIRSGGFTKRRDDTSSSLGCFYGVWLLLNTSLCGYW